MRRQRGFSLIELLIVVAIILVIAAIAIPNFLRSRMIANEAAAAGSMRSVITAEFGYVSTYPSIGYSDSLTKLGPPAGGGAPTPTSAGLLDSVLGCAAEPCLKQGYNFSIANPSGSNPVDTVDVIAVPGTIGVSGGRGFCSPQLGPILYDPAGGTNCTLPIPN